MPWPMTRDKAGWETRTSYTLHDTSILQHKHIDAFKKESDKLMKLLGTNINVLPNVVPVDNDMGDY